MDLFGLIGKSLSHSFSKKYFTNKFEEEKIHAQYELFPLESIDLLTELIFNNPNLKGLNVTIPFKQEVIHFLDEIDVSAKMIGAVNTITIRHINGKSILRGYNTDAVGFEKTLKKLNPNPVGLRALILGTGGAAQAVRYVLRKNGVLFRSVSRINLKSDQLTYHLITASIISKYKLIINTTPVGMYPKIDEAPEIPYHLLTKDHCLIDLIYNPCETLFLKKGRENGAITVNGIEMFENQAEEAWTIWTQNT
ncbi:MAG: shikimate dehydrogenase [Bacteroidetes bacterium HGW-Bacteroidetes-1]|nr:MAG: shikimate dehydrogenase [Bacteroidetes bacterium HGW-Bacteroidetes-1]